MAEERPSDLLGALPRTRPHRRSTKRPAKVDPAPPAEQGASSQVAMASKVSKPGPASKAARRPRATGGSASTKSRRPTTGKGRGGRLRQPPQPRGMPASPRSPVPPAPNRPEVIGTAIQAVAELTEIGLSVTARALRRTLSRLPRP